jgi:uncharacterized protein (TIGR02246 family)
MAMKLSIYFICATLFCSCSGQGTIEEENKDDVSSITAMSNDRANAFNKGDAAAIAGHFTDDGILMAPDFPVSQGRAGVEDYYGKIFSAYETSLESYYEEVEVSGNLAYGRGEAKVRLIDKSNGDTTYSSSKYLNILKKQTDGSWKTTHDIWNDN